MLEHLLLLYCDTRILKIVPNEYCLGWVYLLIWCFSILPLIKRPDEIPNSYDSSRTKVGITMVELNYILHNIAMLMEKYYIHVQSRPGNDETVYAALSRAQLWIQNVYDYLKGVYTTISLELQNAQLITVHDSMNTIQSTWNRLYELTRITSCNSNNNNKSNNCMESVYYHWDISKEYSYVYLTNLMTMLPQILNNDKERCVIHGIDVDFNNSSSSNSNSSEPVRYCYCQEVEDGRCLIACDDCNQRFHPDCMGISDLSIPNPNDIVTTDSTTASSNEVVNDVFYCIICSAIRNIPYKYKW